MKVEQKEILMNYLMLIGFLMFLTALILVAWEFYGATRFCNSIDGYYSFLWNPPTHFCNSQDISRINTQDGIIWGFKANYGIDLPNISISTPN